MEHEFNYHQIRIEAELTLQTQKPLLSERFSKMVRELCEHRTESYDDYRKLELILDEQKSATTRLKDNSASSLGYSATIHG